MPKLVAVVFFCIVQTAFAFQDSRQASEGVSVFDRVAVVGASVSAGFGLDRETKVRTVLADIVELSLLAKHSKVENFATELFFMNAEGTGKSGVERALATKPTLLVAIDYLFWYGYGGAKTEDARLARLEKGLKNLDAFECPILLGDFPNMTQALEAPARMLTKAQVPAPETIVKLNERLSAWAKDKKNVILVPLADMCRRMQTNDALDIRDVHYAKGELKGLLQDDWLHTNVEGTSALWVLALDRLYAQKKDEKVADVRWVPKDIKADVLKAAADGRIAPKKSRARAGADAPASRPAGVGAGAGSR